MSLQHSMVLKTSLLQEQLSTQPLANQPVQKDPLKNIISKLQNKTDFRKALWKKFKNFDCNN